MQFVETVSVNANYISLYDSCIDGKPEVSKTSDVNFFDNFHDCKMSASAIKTIKKAANIICYLSRKRHFEDICAKEKCACTSARRKQIFAKAKKDAKSRNLCTFVTLTLPATQQHSDIELTTYLLNPFFVYARKFFKVRHYVWKKELQQNGNLHFHIITDRFIDCDCLRREWNKLLNQGKVEGVEKPFDYVSRYQRKWLNFYENGFDFDKMYNYISELKSTQDEIEKEVSAFEYKKRCFAEVEEYEAIKDLVIRNKVGQYHQAYCKELKKESPDERFNNPNTTDISAVKSPAQVSYYLSKYISKDVDASPELQIYFDKVDYFKRQIYSTLKDCKEKELNEIDCSVEKEYVEKIKLELQKIRAEECPIKGHLWFKSKSLTVFLKGAKDFVYSDLNDEINLLMRYMSFCQYHKNKRLKKAGKEPVNLIIKTYDKNEDGTDNKNKIICITLLIDCFTLGNIRNKNDIRRFPRLCRLWEMHIKKGLKENQKKGFYKK